MAMKSALEIPFKHIAVEGVFRSRKTQLANVLAQRVGGKVVLDNVGNPYLKDFYNEREGSSFLTQLVFLANRYNQQIRLLQRDLFVDRIICDYLFEKDKIYAYQTLSNDELLVYEKIYGILSERVPKPDLVIYLQISLGSLSRRIAKEGDSIEKNISEKYLEDIVEAFDYFFFNYQSAPLLVVKADDIDFGREEDVLDLLDQLRDMKKASLYYVPQSYGGKGLKKRLASRTARTPRSAGLGPRTEGPANATLPQPRREPGWGERTDNGRVYRPTRSPSPRSRPGRPPGRRSSA
ncbi:MAG: deoxynucleoside kinase [Desulfobacterales bacterium]|nr:deoxynucleoside kinase [Desulfobacterales bacterium]